MMSGGCLEYEERRDVDMPDAGGDQTGSESAEGILTGSSGQFRLDDVSQEPFLLLAISPLARLFIHAA